MDPTGVNTLLQKAPFLCTRSCAPKGSTIKEPVHVGSASGEAQGKILPRSSKVPAT